MTYQPFAIIRDLIQTKEIEEMNNDLANIADSKNDEQWIEDRLSFDYRDVNLKLSREQNRMLSAAQKKERKRLLAREYTRRWEEKRGIVRKAHPVKLDRAKPTLSPKKIKAATYTPVPEGATEIFHEILCARNRAFIIQRGERVLLAFEGFEYTVDQVREFTSSHCTVIAWKKSDIFLPAEQLMRSFTVALRYSHVEKTGHATRFNVGDRLHEVIFNEMIVEEVIITAEGVKYRVADQWKEPRSESEYINEDDAHFISSIEQDEIRKLARG
jgi:hypothetical protein